MNHDYGRSVILFSYDRESVRQLLQESMNHRGGRSVILFLPQNQLLQEGINHYGRSVILFLPLSQLDSYFRRHESLLR